MMIVIFVLVLFFSPYGPMLGFRWFEHSASLEAARDTAKLFISVSAGDGEGGTIVAC
jgi:hypothetical protein